MRRKAPKPTRGAPINAVPKMLHHGASKSHWTIPGMGQQIITMPAQNTAAAINLRIIPPQNHKVVIPKQAVRIARTVWSRSCCYTQERNFTARTSGYHDFCVVCSSFLLGYDPTRGNRFRSPSLKILTDKMTNKSRGCFFWGVVEMMKCSHASHAWIAEWQTKHCLQSRWRGWRPLFQRPVNCTATDWHRKEDIHCWLISLSMHHTC